MLNTASGTYFLVPDLDTSSGRAIQSRGLWGLLSSKWGMQLDWAVYLPENF
jgi:hypothetical protein